jgi:hypothetical protein
MPQLRDFLDRFRPAGAPGAAGRAAVPAERQGELAAELLPVLALLEGMDRECARLLAQAQGEAERIVAGPRETAAANLRDAGRRAATVRADTEQRPVAAARGEAVAAVASARREAHELDELARQRIPMLANRAVNLLRDVSDSATGPAGSWPDRDESGWLG